MPGQQQDVPCADTGRAQGPLQLSWSRGARGAGGPARAPARGRAARRTHPPGRRCGRRRRARGWPPAAPCRTGDRDRQRGELQGHGATAARRRTELQTQLRHSTMNVAGTLPRGRRDPPEHRPQGPMAPAEDAGWKGQVSRAAASRRLPARRLRCSRAGPPCRAMTGGSPEALHLFLQVVSLEMVELHQLRFLSEGELRNLLQVPAAQETVLRRDGRPSVLPPHCVTSPHRAAELGTPRSCRQPALCPVPMDPPAAGRETPLFSSPQDVGD